EARLAGRCRYARGSVEGSWRRGDRRALENRVFGRAAGSARGCERRRRRRAEDCDPGLMRDPQQVAFRRVEQLPDVIGAEIPPDPRKSRLTRLVAGVPPIANASYGAFARVRGMRTIPPPFVASQSSPLGISRMSLIDGKGNPSATPKL